MALELDYMEYSTDPLARAAYNGVESVKVSFETGADDVSSIGDSGGVDYRHGMKFTIAGDIVCTSVSTYISSKTGTPTGDMTFRIETNSGANKPSGTLAHANATGAIPNASLTTAAWNKVNFTPFTLPAGTYWLCISIPNQANNNYWGTSRDNAGGTGQEAYSTDGGTTWTLTGVNTYLNYFRIYETPLLAYSEPTIKTQGDYSLKGVAVITDSLNKTLTRTIT
jgi:hypothetical protein